MKIACMLAALSTLLIGPGLYAQDDLSAIFDDLEDLQPTQSAPAPAPQPTAPPPVRKINDPVFSSAPTPAPQKEQPQQPIDIPSAIDRGKQAFSNGQLDSAQNLFEAVLHSDPYNQTAIRWLRRIADKQASREEKSYTTTRTRMLETVQAAWNTPKTEGAAPDDLSAGDPNRPEPDHSPQALRSKLESLQIPSITFQNAGIQQVVTELSAILRDLDPDKKGVNLVVFGISETLMPPITFSGNDLSALETLNIITQMSGMKVDIGPSMVSLTPVNYESPQQMISVELDIMPAVGQKMKHLAADTTAGPIDVRSFFSTVPFPDGTSADYNPDFNLLLVRNVPKHITAIEALLDRYNQKARSDLSRQVEIETKFIEVAQGALDELGFEWTIGENGTFLNNDTLTVPGGQQLFTDTLRTGQQAFDPTTGSTLADSLTSTAGELLVQKIKGDIQLDILIKALERQQSSDLLSAPRVLAKSGETASIHVGEIRRFPTAYDVVIERYSQPSLVPLDYQEYKTGVLLEVTPQLDPATHTIDLKLAPEIKELAGFDEQHAATVWPDFGDEQLDLDGDTPVASDLLDFLSAREENRTFNADRLVARMPVFKSRRVETAVTIEDGSTIAMGGLIKEQMETFQDSVPILGKVPMIGRLFRSEGERSVKRNLLIFVTASQIDAAGNK